MGRRRKNIQTYGPPSRKEGPVNPTGGTGCLCPDGSYHPECCTGHRKAQGIGRTIVIIEPIPIERVFIADQDDSTIIDSETSTTARNGDLIVVYTEDRTPEQLTLTIDNDGNLIATGHDAQYLSITSAGTLLYTRNYE